MKFKNLKNDDIIEVYNKNFRVYDKNKFCYLVLPDIDNTTIINYMVYNDMYTMTLEYHCWHILVSTNYEDIIYHVFNSKWDLVFKTNSIKQVIWYFA